MKPDSTIDEIEKRFKDGFNADATTPHLALTYRADVGYLLGLLQNTLICHDKIKDLSQRAIDGGASNRKDIMRKINQYASGGMK